MFHPSFYDYAIPWGKIPRLFHPAGGNLPEVRIPRKTIQIERMSQATIRLIQFLNKFQRLSNQENKPLSSSTSRSERLDRVRRIVEFCAGSGYIALPLAHLYPEIEFVVIDQKGPSIDIAKQRIQQSQHDNIRIIEDDISNYSESFDIGIGLHACGYASDIIFDKCIEQKAGFISCPCCIGKIVHFRKNSRSQLFQQHLSEVNYQFMMRAGDVGHSGENCPNNDDEEQQGESSRANDSRKKQQKYILDNQNRRQCKYYIEEDRRLYTLENGYRCIITSMEKTASPKNDILIGWHQQDDLPSNSISVVGTSVLERRSIEDDYCDAEIAFIRANTSELTTKIFELLP